MKGSASVNPMFQPLSITNAHIYNISPLMATDLHRLYFRSSTNSCRWDHKSIINCCFSQKYGALIILSEEGRLHIFTEGLEEIARIPWESKYSVGLQFFDGKNMFLMIGATAVEVQYVRVVSNIKSTKFVSSMNFGLQKKQKYSADSETKLQWNKGYNYHLKQNLLYLWSSKDINFYSLDKLELKSRIVSLTRKDMSITYVFYNTQYKYTITGLINGHIKVWRLPMNNLNNKDYILIHKYVRHTKPVQKIVEGSDDRIIISASEEMMVCLWSLQTFQLLREYDFMGEYSSILLFNGVYSLAFREGELGKLKFGKTMQFVTDITSEGINFCKHRLQAKSNRESPVDSIQVTLASNLGFQIRQQQLNTKDLNKIQIEYIYPPLKAKGILQIISSPYANNQFYLLVESGEIFRLRIENGSGKIQQSYVVQRTKDVEFHQLNQTPTYIKFLNIAPPMFDSQINENTIDKKEKKKHVDDEQNYLKLKLIAIGCNKGTVIFLKTDNIQMIYTRVTYHRQAITCLQSFKSNGNSYLISYCMQFYLKIVKFDNEKANCIISIFTHDLITFIHGLEDRFALVLKKGFFQVFQISSQEQDYSIKNNRISDHQQQILCIDSDPERRLILTAAADNKMKIWTYYKILLYEIVLDDGLKHAVWFRPLQILVSHSLKILYFKNIGLRITAQEIQSINDEFLEVEDEEKVNIQETIKNMKLLKQDVKFEFQDKVHIDRQRKFSKKKLDMSFDLGDSNVSENSPKRKDPKKRYSQQKKKRVSVNQTQIFPQQQSSKQIIPNSDLQIMRKHLDDMKQLKKQTNQSLLPKIKPKTDDAFDNFMKSKLINKKVLTRRDITLNRIIMKNIIKQHFGTDNSISSNLKLDF